MLYSAREQDGALRAVGLLRAEVLADERRGGVRHAPRRQEREDDDPDRDRVARERRAPEAREDAHEADPARRPDERLEIAAAREPQRARASSSGRGAGAPAGSRCAPSRARASTSWRQTAMPRPRRRRDGRARDAERRERPEAEDEARVEDEVDDVREPQDAHRDRRVAGAAEDRVDEEEQDDDDVAAEHHPRERRAGRDDVGRPPPSARGAAARGARPRSPSGTATRTPSAIACTAVARRALGVLLADPPRDHRRRRHREPDRERVEEREHRLRQPDGRDRAAPELRHPEDVHDGEDRLERHLEHHRHREQDDRAPDGPFREVPATRAAPRAASRGRRETKKRRAETARREDYAPGSRLSPRFPKR